VFAVAFPGSTKASHGNAGLLGSDAVSAFFPTVRRKLVSSFSALGGPRVSAFARRVGRFVSLLPEHSHILRAAQQHINILRAAQQHVSHSTVQSTCPS